MSDSEKRDIVIPCVEPLEILPVNSHLQSNIQDHQALPLGTRISEFEITSLIGIGGFGIVYLAHDNSLGRDVALKEYMPSSLAFRNEGNTVTAKSERCAETFQAGLKSFVNEARMLALFDHPSLVKVYRFWEANGTAYMVMPYYDGQTLKQALSMMDAPPSEEWLKNLLVPLLDALQLIHSKNCFHRDIAPDNIFLLNDGQPVLLDFGAARQVIGDIAKNLTVILKPGYAPVEQYAGDPNMPQGAWTDIYALGAVVHFAIKGAAPEVSVSRMMTDKKIPLSQTETGRYSELFLRGIDHALAVYAASRPQSIAALREMLDLKRSIANPTLGTANASVAVAVPKPGNKRMLWGGVSLLSIALMVGTYYFMGDRNQSNNLSSGSMTSQPLVPASEKLPQLSNKEARLAVNELQGSPIAASVFDPALLLERAYELRDREHVVTAIVGKSRLEIGKDSFRFRVKSSQGGYVYILMLGTNRHVNLLFPNALDSNNKIVANKELALPGSHWTMPVEGPPGTDRFVVLVSELPRDFSEAGLVKDGAFGEFPLNFLKAKTLASPDRTNLLSGIVRCPIRSGCTQAYGAASFSVDEVN